jgi:hypothetical protein
MATMVKLQGPDGTVTWVSARTVAYLEPVPDAEVAAQGGTPPWTRVYFTGTAAPALFTIAAQDEDTVAQEINNQGPQ